MAINRLTHETDRNFKLVGIATALRGYKLCYELQTTLDLAFVRHEDLVLQAKNREELKFTVHVARPEHTQNTYFLFANRAGVESLLPEARDFNFLLKITGSYNNTTSLVKTLREIPDIISAMEITVKTLRQADRLVYELPAENEWLNHL